MCDKCLRGRCEENLEENIYTRISVLSNKSRRLGNIE